MSVQPVPGRPYWFYDRSVQQYFRYDPQSDRLLYPNGVQVARHASVPRSFYIQAHQQNYQNLPPPTSTDGYAQDSDNFMLASGSRTVPQYSRGAETPRPTGRHQSQPSVDAAAASLQDLSLQGSGPQPQVYERDGIRLELAQNLQSQVRTIIGTGPADKITDPELYQGGVRAHRRLYGTEGESETLYSNFKLKSHDFFSVGRVFFILWAEPAGESRTAITHQEPSDSTVQGRYRDERIYSKVRRFVIVRTGRDYCSALPIMTYRGQGVGKPGVNKSEHAIIYTGSQPPRPLSSELPQHAADSPMRQHAVRVVSDDRESKLDPMSRIDFGKVHTIQHNIKVRPFGMVHQRSMEALVSQFNNVWLGNPGSSATNAPSASTPRSASGSGAGSSGRRMSVDSEVRTTRRGTSRSGGNLGAIDSDEEEDSDAESDDDGSESDDNGAQRNAIEAARTQQAYARLRNQNLNREQAISSMAMRLRQLNPSLTQEAAVARVRAQLPSSS